MVYIVRKHLANFINLIILIVGSLSGFFHSHTKLFYENFLFLFLFISIVMFTLCQLIHIVGKYFGKKSQPKSTKEPKYFRWTIRFSFLYLRCIFYSCLAVYKLLYWKIKRICLGYKGFSFWRQHSFKSFICYYFYDFNRFF